MSRIGQFGNQLYRGEVSFDFVERRKRWYIISAVLLAVSLASLIGNGLSLGIEFRGGAEFRVKSPTVTQTAVRDAVGTVIKGEIVVQDVGKNAVRAQTGKLTSGQVGRVQQTLSETFGVSRNAVSTDFIGPSWGRDISAKALRALVFFLLGLIVFLSLYFEWRMALAAIIALAHDLFITVGIYSLVGFEVTPATVIGFLTILGYSLYDTVVVFDKVRENTAGLAGGSRRTYSQAANLALNQTLVRSINTSIIALLPIGAILVAGIALLGTGPLKDLALALFIGVAVGTYSSIFIATPVLAAMKEREPAMQALAKRVAARQAGGGGTATSRRRAASRPGENAAAADTDGTSSVDTVEEPATGADADAVGTAVGRGQPAHRPAGGAQRRQPQKKGTRKSGGKKRR